MPCPYARMPATGSSRLPVGDLDRFQLVGRQTCLPKDRQNQICLSVDVVFDVLRKLTRQALLELAIFPRRVRMRSQVVAHRDLIDESEASGRTQVQVVIVLTLRTGECFATLDAEIAAVRIAERRETLDCAGNLRLSRHDN